MALQVRSARPVERLAVRQRIDPWRPLSLALERERDETGTALTATVFLAGAECPFTCVFCDLWRYTLDGPTPEGAIPAQIAHSLAVSAGLGVQRLKLYNASNFFEPRAVPECDDRRILELIAPLQRSVVECHPRLIGDRFERYAAELKDRLEVALGLETANAEILSRLNKGASLDDLDRAIERILAAGSRVRAFVLVGVPFLEEGAQLEWVVRSVEYALSRGVNVVSLIPVRGGNGTLERLLEAGEWRRPSLELVEDAFDCLAEDSRGVVLVDLWDLGTLECCDRCRDQRLARLRQMNVLGRRLPAVDCGACERPPA